MNSIVVLVLSCLLANASRVPKPAHKKVVERKPLQLANINTTTANGDAQADEQNPKRNSLLQIMRTNSPKLKTVKTDNVDSNTPWYLQAVNGKENRRSIYQACYFERPQKPKVNPDLDAIKSEDEDSDGNDNDNKKPKDQTESSVSKSDSVDNRWWMSHEWIVKCDPEPFARGAYGRAYRATCIANVKAVIKIITIENGDDLAKLRTEWAENEIKILKRFKCKWITRSYFDLKENLQDCVEYMICMEDGGISLQALYITSNPGKIANDNLSRLVRGQYLALMVVKALLVCHRKNILHLDVAPKNVVINSSGEVRLCDFGLAEVMDKNGKTFGHTGTPCFMCYKALIGGEYGVEADYYSLGAFMFAIDQLREPLEDFNVAEIMEFHEDGGKLCDTMIKNTDQRIFNTVKQLCAGVDDEEVEKMALFEAKLKQQNLAAPKSVLEDVAAYMASHQ